MITITDEYMLQMRARARDQNHPDFESRAKLWTGWGQRHYLGARAQTSRAAR